MCDIARDLGIDRRAIATAVVVMAFCAVVGTAFLAIGYVITTGIGD